MLHINAIWWVYVIRVCFRYMLYDTCHTTYTRMYMLYVHSFNNLYMVGICNTNMLIGICYMTHVIQHILVCISCMFTVLITVNKYTF